MTAPPDRWKIAAWSAVVALGVGAFAIDLATPLGIAVGVPYVLAVLATLALETRPGAATWAVAATGTVLVWIGFGLSPEDSGRVGAGLADRSLATLGLLGAALAVDLHGRRSVARITALEGRLEGLARLASGVAHDFNNLLTVVSWEVSRALDASSGLGVEAREGLDKAARVCDEAGELVAMLYQYSADHMPSLQPVELGRFVVESSRLLEAIVECRGQLSIEHVEKAVEVRVDPTWMRQILVNLVSNAALALDDGGHGVVAVRVGATRPDAASLAACVLAPSFGPGREYALLEVSDEGSGISPEVLPRIFDPFFTAREGGKGVGLASVFGLVRSLGGGIHVESEVGRGSRFGVLLPTLASSDASTPAAH